MGKYEQLKDDDDKGFFKKIDEYFGGSIIVKIGFSVFLGIGFFISLFTRDNFYGLADKLTYIKIANTSVWNQICQVYSNEFKASCSGPFVAYRVGFALVIFYLIILLFSSRICFFVKNKLKLRILQSCVFWTIAYLLFIVILILSLLIPDFFFIGWGYLSIFCSAIFIIIQLIVFIDFAYVWQEKWISKGDDYGGSIFHWFMLSFSIIFIIIGLLVFASEIVFFGIKLPCHFNRILIISVLILGIILIIITVLRKKGLLPGSIIFSYTAIATWSALTSYPDDNCATFKHFFSPKDSNSGSQIINIVISLSLAFISCLSILKTTISTPLEGFCSFTTDEEREKMEKYDDEDELATRKSINGITMSIIIFIFSSFYIGVVLNNWSIPRHESRVPQFVIEVSIYSYIAKAISVYVALLLYGWSLIAKYILFCRDFNEDYDSD